MENGEQRTRTRMRDGSREPESSGVRPGARTGEPGRIGEDGPFQETKVELLKSFEEFLASIVSDDATLVVK